jgi:hypothetical protein
MKSDVIHVTSEGTGTDPFLMQSNSPREEWDELEKSIVANIADEVQISIRDTTVEMVIFKKF